MHKKYSLILRIAAVIMAMMTLAAILTGCGGKTENEKPAPTLSPDGPEKDYPGLYVDDNGVIYLGGKKFYGYGLNLFSTFQSALIAVNNKSSYSRDKSLLKKEAFKADFELCKEYGITIVRIPFSSWGLDAYNSFSGKQDVFFSVMDQIVAAAEEAHVGIIADLFWNQDTLPYYVKEKRAAYGNTESATMEFARKYTAAVVQRYKDSPAIWGWEIGNEYNLSADLCNLNKKEWIPSGFTRSPITYEDYYSSAECIVFLSEVAKEIRKYDQTRLITTGNGVNRDSSWHLHQKSEAMADNHTWEIDWTADSREEFMEMVQYFTPDPIDTVCFHYGYSPDLDSMGEYFSQYTDAAKNAKKGLFFGEFGDLYDFETLENNTMEEFEGVFDKLLGFMVEGDIQIACGWFNWDNTKDDRFNHTLHDLSDINRYKLEKLQSVNEEFRNAGLQAADEYWAKYASAS